MNVLSLFDGMSCGQIALNRAGINYDNYFASEIDKYAIKVTQHNYPKTIQLGSVVNVKAVDLPKVDLLIGGSPCQGFSFAGKQLNFNDERSKLFFEFVRLLEECKPKYFLLENVKMAKEYELVINKYLGCRPMRLNSAWVSAQNRERLYWTNIPVTSIPENKRLCLGDIMTDFKDISERYNKKVIGTLSYEKSRMGTRGLHQKSKTLLRGGQSISNSGATNVLIDGKVYMPTLKECCRLQTVPENYFDSIIPDYKAIEFLGNGWTVDIIVHIFKHI